MNIVIGVDGYAEGNDAARLGSVLAQALDARVTLLGVHLDPLVLPITGFDFEELEKEEHRILRRARDAFAPDADLKTETDLSVPRALHRVARRDGCDVLVVGSSRRGAEGRVQIGRRTRQLLSDLECPLAVAPRGLHEHAATLRTIGVGYDGEPESTVALSVAQAIAERAGAELVVHGVIDDRVPVLMRSPLNALLAAEWEEVIAGEEGRLREQALAEAGATSVPTNFALTRGRPGEELLTWSANVDLLVIGSRRWGPAARVLLGSTGEALMHGAACPVLAVPRPGH
jgi:nucleotide-binding universal stress UspA family protein